MNNNTVEKITSPRWHAVDLALLITRVTLGVIFLAHGSQKLFGAFGGPGLEKWIELMGPAGYLVAIGEFFGGVGLIVGFLSRFSAASIIIIMIGALVMVHGKNGFFLSNNGMEYVLALIALALATLLAGPGRYALSRLISRRSCWCE